MSSPKTASPPNSGPSAAPTSAASPEPSPRPSTSTASPRRGSRVRAWSSPTRQRTGCTPRSSAPPNPPTELTRRLSSTMPAPPHTTSTPAPAAAATRQLSTLDKWLPVWIGLAMIAGLLLGRFIPALADMLTRMEVAGISVPIGLGLLVMMRSEEHTSELQSRGHLVCRLLLEEKNYVARDWLIQY